MARFIKEGLGFLQDLVQHSREEHELEVRRRLLIELNDFRHWYQAHYHRTFQDRRVEAGQRVFRKIARHFANHRPGMTAVEAGGGYYLFDTGKVHHVDSREVLTNSDLQAKLTGEKVLPLSHFSRLKTLD